MRSRSGRAAAGVLALAGIGAAAGLLACGRSGESAPAGGEAGGALAGGRQIVLAVDLSGSRSDYHRGEARAAAEGVIRGMGFGDQIVVLQIHRRAADEEGAVRWRDVFPSPRNPARPTSFDVQKLEGAKRGAREVVESVFASDSAGRIATTDLVATLHVAAEYLADSERERKVLVLLSDMLQSAHGIEMSDTVPDAAWIERQRELGTLPELTGACVLVVGADATTPHGVRVREFWRAYLRAAGARLPDRNWRLIAPSDPDLGCPA